MALFNREQLIKEYFEKEIKEKYPHLKLEQVQDVCKLPFDGIVEWIKSGLFPHIMITYLGKILVNERRLRIRLNKLEVGWELKKISEEYYLRRKQEILDHLEELKHVTNKEERRRKKSNSKNIKIIDDDIQTSCE
jgi:hypothetical protein